MVVKYIQRTIQRDNELKLRYESYIPWALTRDSASIVPSKRTLRHVRRIMLTITLLLETKDDLLKNDSRRERKSPSAPASVVSVRLLVPSEVVRCRSWRSSLFTRQHLVIDRIGDPEDDYLATAPRLSSTLERHVGIMYRRYIRTPLSSYTRRYSFSRGEKSGGRCESIGDRITVN